MKKVGIITLNGNFNFGNRLQNYALEQTLSKLGFQVETLVIPEEPKKTKAEKSATVITFNRILGKVKYTILKKRIAKLKMERLNRFEGFSAKNLNERLVNFSDENEIKKINEEFNYFVTGSDQVWNPFYTKYKMELYFLTFTSFDKRIAYAPSFGIDFIPDEYKEEYRRWIQGMKHISVREDAGSKIIKDLTGRNVEVLVDPTLLLTKKEWLAISESSPQMPSKGYLLTYFLGEITKEYKKYIRDIARKYNLEIVNLSKIDVGRYFTADPSQFIKYIDDCTVFCTDSFHGTVFSIILEKAFIVFRRTGSSSMYSRIETLLDKFKLQDRQYDVLANRNTDIISIQFEDVQEILNDEREKSMTYLAKSMEDEGNKDK